MPTLDSAISDVVVGDDFTIRRTIDRSASGYATGVTITNAWLTVKAELADADPGLIQKSITTTPSVGVGEIEDDGTGDVDPIVRFDLVPADTILIGAFLRNFDIQVKTNGGLIHTPESGTIICHPQVTTTVTP